MNIPRMKCEAQRLKALLELNLMNSGTSPEFDAIAHLTAKTLDFPIALISLIGEDNQWFKANCGLNIEATPRDVAFCSHTIESDRPLIVRDARLDPRFKNNPLVLGSPHIVFYAGVPISIDGVHNLGSLCVIDTRPRHLNAAKLDQLCSFARIAEGLIMAFKSQRQAEEATANEAQKAVELTKTKFLLEQVKELSGVGGWEYVLNPPWTCPAFVPPQVLV